MEQVKFYTDGACRGNPGQGGWGVVMCHGGQESYHFGAEEETTNNRMEITAALRALQMLPHSARVLLTTDSKYLIQGITQWITKWKANEWRTADKRPVSNQDLWLLLDECNQRHQVEWAWVKGHSHHRENELADQLANLAIDGLESLRPKAGARPPGRSANSSNLKQPNGHLFEAEHEQPTERPARGPTPVLQATDSNAAPSLQLNVFGLVRSGGNGGWAAIVEDGVRRQSFQGGARRTTENRMVLTAVLKGLEALPKPSRVVLCTFSEYLYRGLSNWLPRWVENNWRNSSGDQVKNKDLWEALLALGQGRHELLVRWSRDPDDAPISRAEMEALAGEVIPA